MSIEYLDSVPDLTSMKLIGNWDIYRPIWTKSNTCFDCCKHKSLSLSSFFVGGGILEIQILRKINKLDKKRFPRLRRDEIGSLWKKSWFEENKFDARRRCVALICFEVGSSGDGLCEYCDLFKIDWWVSIGPWPILLTFYDCILSRTNCKFIVIENSRVVIYDWSPMGHYCSPI